MGYERPYYEEINYRPFLFYVVFGVNDEQLNVSKTKHHVDKFPDGLDFSFLKKPENSTYMENFLGGSLGEILKDKKPCLFSAIQDTVRWAVIKGEVQEDMNLNYMKNVIGFVQALVEKEAIGVLDLQTLTLSTPKEWTEKIFEKVFDPYEHVTILVSEMEDGYMWLHTRGMRKFGRPDISIEKVKENAIEIAASIINQMIFYGVQGAFFSRSIKLHTHSGFTCILNPKYMDDLENPDFNNSYYYVLWEECEIEPEIIN